MRCSWKEFSPTPTRIFSFELCHRILDLAFYSCQIVGDNDNITDDTVHDIRKGLHTRYFALFGKHNFYTLRSIFVVRYDGENNSAIVRSMFEVLYNYHIESTEDDVNRTNSH